MSYKLIALDLDDTLLNSRGEISSYTLRVLAQAKAQGCYVVIATGRSFAGARRHYAVSYTHLKNQLSCGFLFFERSDDAHVYHSGKKFIVLLRR